MHWKYVSYYWNKYSCYILIQVSTYLSETLTIFALVLIILIHNKIFIRIIIFLLDSYFSCYLLIEHLMSAIALNPLHEITSLTELHDYHKLISTLNHVVYVDDMWVLQLSLQMNLRDNKYGHTINMDVLQHTNMYKGRKKSCTVRRWNVLSLAKFYCVTSFNSYKCQNSGSRWFLCGKTV